MPSIIYNSETHQSPSVSQSGSSNWNGQGVVDAVKALIHIESFNPTLCYQNAETLSADKISFLETQAAEIEQMYTHRTSSGNWRKLGSGVTKNVYVHPDFPGMLLKMPRGKSGVMGATGEDDLRLHHTNLRQIQKIANQFDRIVLPESHLYSTSKGLILVEQKFDLTDYEDVPDSPDKQEAARQFKAFKRDADLCDISPIFDQNAGIISQSSPVKIGIFDVDCTNEGRERRVKDIQNNKKKHQQVKSP